MLMVKGIPFHGISVKHELNCSDLIELQYIPTLPEVLAEIGTPGIVLVSIAGCITLAITIIFIEEMIKLNKLWPLQIYCFTVAVLAVFPIASLCFLLTLLTPRAHDVNTTTATLYQPLSMVLFFKLIMSYSGGEVSFKTNLEGQKIPLQGPPFYCLTFFCPTTYMSMNLYYLMKVSIYQLFLAPCFLYFVMGICSKTGVYVAGQFSFENAHIYIMILGFISFCIGVYALVIFCKMAQEILIGYSIHGKYYIIQTFFVITRCHVLVFDTLGNNGYLPCYSPISAFSLAIYLRSSLLLIQAFILSVIARSFFLRKPPSTQLDTFESVVDQDPNI